MIDKDLLSSMKEGAVLVSISRAGVINETDLRKVLLSRPDIRVGIDVLGGDSTDRNLLSPLLDYRQVLATPHMGGAAVEANLKAAKIAHDLIAEWSKEREDKTLLEG